MAHAIVPWWAQDAACCLWSSLFAYFVWMPSEAWHGEDLVSTSSLPSQLVLDMAGTCRDAALKPCCKLDLGLIKERKSITYRGCLMYSGNHFSPL